MDLRSRLFLTLLAFSPALVTAQTPSAPAPETPSTGPAKTCPIITAKPSPGDTQLAKRDYKAAEVTFRAEMAANAASEDAHLGLVRSLIGEDKVDDAQAEAAAMLKEKPRSAVAQGASAEAAYRAADVGAAMKHALAALTDDPCEARAVTAAANILDLSGYHAKEATLLRQAHNLRPNDELIRRDWISSLPRKQRGEELTRYLEGEHSLSVDDARAYDNELGHLKARRPGECHITSKADSTRLKLQPIFGDHSYPVAFGLDVNFNNTRRRMQIDTGASGILLTQSAARALKLEPEYRLKTGGVGDEGQLDSYLAHVHHIQIGDVEVSDCMVEVVNRSKLDVDGLIGMDVFNRWLVTLDYADGEARLDPLPARPGSQSADNSASSDDTGDDNGPKDRYIAPEMKDWNQVLRIGHNILLPARFKKDSPVHFLIMDTGASATNLSVTMAKEAGKLHSSPVEFVGLSGKVKKVYEIDSNPLIAGNLILPSSPYYAYDMTNISHDSGFEVSGLLGLPTLQRLTIQIDYRDNLLKLSYDPKHDVVRF